MRGLRDAFRARRDIASGAVRTTMRFAKHLSSPARRSLPAAVLVVAGLGPGPASARLSQADLAGVAAAPAPGARAPLDLAVIDAATERPTTLGAVLGGRPALLLPVDYTCANVCDPMVAMSVDALAATGLPGEDRALVLVGLDPRDGPEAARAMIRGVIGGTLGDRAAPPQALVADGPAVARLMETLGYRSAYDPGTDGFAHPAAALLLAGDGRVARVLSPLALDGRTLRLALAEAGEGRVGTLADRLALLCYGYDAARGAYTPLVRRILTAAGAATVVGIGLLVLALTRVRRREAGRPR
jgi:protein SCO1